MGEAPDDRELARALWAWFERSARALPWRTTPRDPYRSLVSEFMLQQTQVSRVVERFGVFLERFPTPRELASADESEVLGLWSGLGYYRRARLLHACARAIVERHGGAVPEDVDELRALPGVGPYTAGAIASIVFGAPEPAVDGNAVRVVLRLGGEDLDPSLSSTRTRVTVRAGAILAASEEPGVVSEALMELGATVCTPASPDCASCPVSDACAAHRQGLTDRIPRPKKRAARRDLYASALLVRDDTGRVLAERRAAPGLWHGLWHPPTVERDDAHAGEDELARELGAEVLGRAGSFTHATTHRAVHFVVHRAAVRGPGDGQRFLTLDELAALGLSSAHRRVFEME